MSRIFRRHRDRSLPVDEESDDADLLAAVAEENLEALQLLHRRHAPWLRVRLMRRCADTDLVDEALQDTLTAIWRSASGFRAAKGEAPAWIWAIAIRRLISRLREPSSRWIGVGWEPDENAARIESAEDVVLLRVEHGDLGSALARLSPELRTVIQMTVLDGLSVAEAAKALGIPVGTVKTRSMRARALLREYLS